MEEKILLKEEEAADLLSMSRHFLRRDRISASSIGVPFIRIGSAIRYRRLDLEAWIQEKSKVSSQKLERQSVHVDTDTKRRRGRPKKIDKISDRSPAG